MASYDPDHKSAVEDVQPTFHDSSENETISLDGIPKNKVHGPPAHEHLDDEQAAKRLKLFRESAQNDPNIPIEDINEVDDAIHGHDVDKENTLIQGLVEDSPYPEVCSMCDRIGIDHLLTRWPCRSVPLSGTTTSMSQPTRFEHG